jgi:CheY-like chemotaxis protein
MARVTVHDTGVGLGQDMLACVFDLFTQDVRTLARSSGGLGIGLTIVKRLVELHGGSVAAESQGPGTGSTFTVRLPLRNAVSGVADAAKADRVAVAPKRVLVVEDNPDVRESLRIILEIWGHDVEFAGTGAEGLARARALQPDVAFIDIGLPELNGYEVACGIRQSDSPWARRVRLIALTGYGSDSDRQRAIDAGFDSHLVKPVDPEILAETLEERLAMEQTLATRVEASSTEPRT